MQAYGEKIADNTHFRFQEFPNKTFAFNKKKEQLEVCVCVCVRACVRACVCACACVGVGVDVGVGGWVGVGVDVGVDVGMDVCGWVGSYMCVCVITYCVCECDCVYCAGVPRP